MNRLAAQPAQCRQAFLQRAAHRFDVASDTGRLDAGGKLDQLRQATHIPRNPLRQCRMEEPAQRPIQSSEGRPQAAQHRFGRVHPGEQLARQIRRHAGRIAPVVLLHAPQVLALLGGDEFRHPQRSILLREVAQNAHLAVRGLGFGVPVHDLQHILRPVGGPSMEIAVPLARQRRHRQGQAVNVARDPFRFRDAEERWRAAQSQQAGPRGYSCFNTKSAADTLNSPGASMFTCVATPFFTMMAKRCPR